MNEETSLMWQIACFCVCGALLGVLYEPLRILRLIIPHHSFITGVEDTAYLSLCGVVPVSYTHLIACSEPQILLYENNIIDKLSKPVYSFVEDTFSGEKERRILFEKSLDVDMIVMSEDSLVTVSYTHLITALCNLRTSSKALAHGDYTPLQLLNRQFSFRRDCDG